MSAAPMRDLRHALRALLRSPSYAAAVLLALVVGTGVGASLLTLLRSGALRQLVPGDLVGAAWRTGWTAAARTAHQLRLGGLETLLTILRPLALLVLGIACVNLVVLLLARASTRGHEVSVRSALGARPLRLARHLLTEGAALCALGLAAGVGLAGGVLWTLRATLPGEVERWPGVASEPAALGLAGGALAGTVLLFSLVPLRPALRRNLQAALGAAARATPGRHEGDARKALVVLATAAALVLLTCAGLLLRAFTPVHGTGHSGVDPRGVLAFRVDLGAAASAAERQALTRAVQERLRQLPAVEAESLGSVGAWSGPGVRERVKVACGTCVVGMLIMPVIDGDAEHHAVAPGYFRALGTKVLRGRELAPGDEGSARPGAVINRAFAYRLFPGGEPLGKPVRVGGEGGTWYTVVGVVENVRVRGIGSGATAAPAIYLPALLHPPGVAEVVVRSGAPPERLLPELRSALRKAHPSLRPVAAATLSQELERRAAPLRWFAWVFGGLAAAAVALSAAGLYGVISFGVARRTREIGVRMAVGARAAEVVRLVVGQSVRLVAVGAVLGLMGALSLARLLQLLLYGIRPTDPVVYAALALLLGSVAVAASALPARRAARVDPVVALRAE